MLRHFIALALFVLVSADVGRRLQQVVVSVAALHRFDVSRILFVELVYEIRGAVIHPLAGHPFVVAGNKHAGNRRFVLFQHIEHGSPLRLEIGARAHARTLVAVGFAVVSAPPVARIPVAEPAGNVLRHAYVDVAVEIGLRPAPVHPGE